MMNKIDKWHSGWFKNFFQSAGIIVLMGLNLWIGASLLLGEGAFLYIFTGFVLFLLVVPDSSRGLILRGGRELSFREAPQLFEILERLSHKAGLEKLPRLFLVSRPDMNAFAFGSREKPAVAVTVPLVRQLGARELEGVLAHEISHIKNRDLFLLSLARNTEAMTSFLSSLGLILLFFNLPLLLFGGGLISFGGILFLIVAPRFSRWLWLALSRTREFQADAGAAELTGDPRGLASALRKLKPRSFSFLGYFFSYKTDHTGTHPDMDERIRRLEALTPEPEKSVHWFWGLGDSLGRW